MSRAPTPRLGPVWLVLGGMLSVQFGAVISKGLFGEIPPVGMVLLRLATSSLILLAVARPRVRGRSAVDWAVPVLAPTSTFGINAEVAVPEVTVLTIISRSLRAVVELTASLSRSGWVLSSTRRLGARTVSTTYGFMTSPSLAMPAATMAICNGVAATSYWPMPL